MFVGTGVRAGVEVFKEIAGSVSMADPDAFLLQAVPNKTKKTTDKIVNFIRLQL